MPMINDGRECTKAVNDMMWAQEQERFAPKIQIGQIAETFYAGTRYLYGHYDSRGGATIVKAPNLMEAHRKYLKICDWDENTSDVLIEDFIGKFDVVFMGTLVNGVPEAPSLKPGVDLLYGENFTAFKMEAEWAPGEWAKIETLVFIPSSDLPKSEKDGEDEEDGFDEDEAVVLTTESDGVHYRLTAWELGEDAFGCVWDAEPYEPVTVVKKFDNGPHEIFEFSNKTLVMSNADTIVIVNDGVIGRVWKKAQFTNYQGPSVTEATILGKIPDEFVDDFNSVINTAKENRSLTAMEQNYLKVLLSGQVDGTNPTSQDVF